MILDLFKPKPKEKPLSLKEKIELSLEERARREAEFVERYGDDLSKLCKEYPEINGWGGRKPDGITLSIKERNKSRMVDGHLIFNDEGDVVSWRADYGELKYEMATPSLSDEMRVAQLSGLLRDSDVAFRYCEQVAAALLDEGTCVFNAPYGLKIKEEEYAKRYGKDWEKAWESALLAEFQAKEVVSTGNGCFKMEAI